MASKGRFERAKPAKARAKLGLPAVTTISRDEFMEATTDIWELAPESATRVGHPAPFPIELPERLIHLYTYRGDVVLDPFMGSGTTAIAAARNGRHYVGYDTDPAYVERAEQRIAAELAIVTPAALSPVEVPGTGKPEAVGDLVADARREGRSAKELVRELLAVAGCGPVKDKRAGLGGVEVTFSTVGPDAQTWYVDVVGGFTGIRPGLQRADALWKTIGKAAVLRQLGAGDRYLVCTAGLPAPRTAGGKALAAAGLRIVDLNDPSVAEQVGDRLAAGRDAS
ncbi:MAG: DNA methyltransferase [Ilumatobacteraceae bacterium]